MSHSLNKIWIHGVFTTKDCVALIKPEFEPLLYKHLKDMLENQLQCPTRIINGIEDHLHFLFLLNPNICVADTFQRIKGESSHWINQSDFSKNKFAWQTGYGAFSVSESMIKTVEMYIRNQKEHHRHLTFADEYNEFIKKYSIVVNR